MPRNNFIPSVCVVGLCAALVLTGCSKDASVPGSDPAANGELPLPQPQAIGGSVTGMPDRPGPHATATTSPVLPGGGPPAVAIADGTASDTPAGIAGDAGDTGAPDASATAQDADEPSTQDAVSVLRDYYAAIGQRDYLRARGLWSDGGRSSGQSPQQFADGFASTTSVKVDTDTPGPIQGAAGSRYIEVPVSIDATQRDGSVRRYSGTYTLRRAVVDGASVEQRAWRIASAQLHETTP